MTSRGYEFYFRVLMISSARESYTSKSTASQFFIHVISTKNSGDLNRDRDCNMKTILTKRHEKVTFAS